MRRILSTGLCLALTLSMFAFSGCGGGADTETVTTSPEAKKADTGGQDAMKEFMQGKSAKKPAAK